MQRARETCELVGLGDTVVIDPDLVEWNYGQYEGLTPKQIHETAPGWLIFRDGCPDGESPGQVGARVDRVIARARRGRWRRCAVRPRARDARTRSALDRVAGGRRAALLARHRHPVRSRLLPGRTRREDLEWASRWLAGAADLSGEVRNCHSDGSFKIVAEAFEVPG